MSERHNKNESSIIIDDKQKFDVENIVDFRLMKRAFNERLQYKIR